MITTVKVQRASDGLKVMRAQPRDSNRNERANKLPARNRNPASALPRVTMLVMIGNGLMVDGIDDGGGVVDGRVRSEDCAQSS